MLDAFLTHLDTDLSERGRRVAPATIRATRSDLRAFSAWWAERHRLPFDPALVLATDLDDYLAQLQQAGRAPSTINRHAASLRALFGWLQRTGRLPANVAERLTDRPLEEAAPRGLNLDGVEWLLRVAGHTADRTERLRDLALLTLLSDAGLRSQEAADLELRDVDCDGGVIIVRAGKGRQTRRVLLDLDGPTITRLRDYIDERARVLATSAATDTERERFLIARAMAAPGQPWRPGMTTVTMRKRLITLRSAAVAHVQVLAAREPHRERAEELRALADDLAHTSPHALRHGLAYRLYDAGATPKTVARQFGHRRESTAMRYGKAKDRDIRRVMARANRRGSP